MQDRDVNPAVWPLLVKCTWPSLANVQRDRVYFCVHALVVRTARLYLLLV